MHRALKKCSTCTMGLGHVLVSPPQMERGSAFFGLARTSMRCVLRSLVLLFQGWLFATLQPWLAAWPVTTVCNVSATCPSNCQCCLQRCMLRASLVTSCNCPTVTTTVNRLAWNTVNTVSHRPSVKLQFHCAIKQQSCISNMS